MKFTAIRIYIASMNTSLKIIDPLISQAILNNIGDGILFLNANDVLVYINRAAEKIRDLGSDTGIERFMTGFSIPTDAASGSSYELFADLKSGNKPIHRQIIEDKLCIYENTFYPIRNIEGLYLGTLIVCRDVTEKEKLKEETVALREQIQLDSGCGDMIGNSPAMLPIFQLIHAAAGVDSTIMITGESGTGKELVARAIHQHGRRKNLAMVKVNCAALPDSLLESELFGYDKGAFTGAIKDRIGKFEQADGGTIFLDEIAEMPLSAQAKLLRVLQERTVERLGGNREIRVDVRIIAATNKNLQREVTNGTFREDLYYRLNVIPINLPPLRERREDILILARQFLNRYAERMHKPVLDISLAARNALEIYRFPGNVRELENTMERAMALSLGGELRLEHLPTEYGINQTAYPAASVSPIDALLSSNVTVSTKAAILEALRATGNRKGEAAQRLGISRKTLWEKMKIHEIDASLSGNG